MYADWASVYTFKELGIVVSAEIQLPIPMVKEARIA